MYFFFVTAITTTVSKINTSSPVDLNSRSSLETYLTFRVSGNLWPSNDNGIQKVSSLTSSAGLIYTENCVSEHAYFLWTFTLSISLLSACLQFEPCFPSFNGTRPTINEGYCFPCNINLSILPSISKPFSLKCKIKRWVLQICIIRVSQLIRYRDWIKDWPWPKKWPS